jgi:UDP-N-acetylmuramate dehydrogenase
MRHEFVQDLKQHIVQGTVLEQEPMGRHTTFQVGGPADLFVEPGNREEVRYAVIAARRERVPFFVTGNGSNLLVSDEGYRGMIIHIGKKLSSITVSGDVIEAEAGVSLARLARMALSQGLTGMEFAAGIPGSLGGAVVMNAGAYDGEMKGILISVDVMTPEGDFISLPAEELDLSYRHSSVIERGYLVLAARLKLAPGDPEAIRDRMDELALARKTKQPLDYPSAGSTFKRPKGYFAGKLVQDTGLKGYRVGGAKVSEKHSGFVINVGGAEAEEIRFLINQVRKKVFRQFGVILEPEVRFLGFDDPLDTISPKDQASSQTTSTVVANNPDQVKE